MPLQKPETPPGPLADLFDALHELYRHAGEPSIREITARTPSGISRDTVHRALTAGKVPRLPVLLDVVAALDGNTASFADLWRVARLAEEAAGVRGLTTPQPAEEVASPSRAEIGVMIVDDMELVHEGLKAILLSQEGFEVVASVTTGEEAVRVAREVRPDVILMDVLMPGITGIEATAKLCEADPSVRVVMLTVRDDQETILRSVAAGAVGFVSKTEVNNTILDSIRKVAAGGRAFSPYVADIVIRDYARLTSGPSLHPGLRLSPRERDIVRLIGQAKPLMEIAELLSISTNTASAHMRSILHKLGLNSRAELVRFAIKAGLD